MECATLNVLVFIVLPQVILEEIKELIALVCCQAIWEHLAFWKAFFLCQNNSASSYTDQFCLEGKIILFPQEDGGAFALSQVFRGTVS